VTLKETPYDLEFASLFAESTSAVVDRELHELDRLLERSGNRIVLYGAGSIGRRALSCLRSIGVEPLAFADADPLRWGTTLENVRILSPQQAAGYYGADATFLVTIWNAGQRFWDTKQRLAAMGCSSVAPPSSLQWRFSQAFLPFFSLDLPSRIADARADALRASGIWADDRSRREYFAHIRWRLYGDLEGLPAPTVERQYFPAFVEFVKDEVFVDCGAFDGDTIRALHEHCDGAFGHAIAIEPVPGTFGQLKEWVAQSPSTLRSRIELWNSAVGSTSGTIRFTGTGRDARAADDGELTVPMVTLDELCGTRRVTYIKMDIEGAEFEALRGAKHTILRERPALAVCVYHTASDIWRIPLMIHELMPDYQLFLRSHENDGWETVVYAVPPERVAGAKAQHPI
jgi:FkbM family methyltransferase